MSLCRVNGQPAEGVPVRDRGLAYGDGLFETIRVQAGQPKLFERHLQRLEHGVGRCVSLAIWIGWRWRFACSRPSLARVSPS